MGFIRDVGWSLFDYNQGIWSRGTNKNFIKKKNFMEDLFLLSIKT